MPVPAPAAIDLHNKLISLPYSDRGEIGRLSWQLRKLYRENPGDLAAGVALLVAFCMEGKAAEAFPLARSLIGHHWQMSPGVRHNFVGSLVNLGMFNEAVGLCSTPTSDAASSECKQNLLQAAYGLGDTKMMLACADMLDDSNRSAVHAAVATIDRLGLAGYLPGHQAAVMDVLRGRFTGFFCAARAPGDDGGAWLSCVLHVDADRKERRLMEADIDDRAAAFSAAHGLAADSWGEAISILVLDIASHWQVPIEPNR